MSITVLTADQVEKNDLDEFLDRVYPTPKSTFIRRYGTWWHGNDTNRWVLIVDRKIAGYCAVIPTKCLVNGEPIRAVWWVDLVIHSDFRGQGLQTSFDTKVKEADLILGFPNELAAKIHRKHGWGVRDDFQALLLPLRPWDIASTRSASGWRGGLLREVAISLKPFAAGLRYYYRRCNVRNAYRLETPSVEVLEAVYRRHRSSQVITACRDLEFLRWRYLGAPYRSEFLYYLAGSPSAPTHYAVARHTRHNGLLVVRLLDLFGDFENYEGLSHVVRLVVKDAVMANASQVTALASLPSLRRALHSAGFFVSAKSRFCWQSRSANTMRYFNDTPMHWGLGDSDNDAPV